MDDGIDVDMEDTAGHSGDDQRPQESAPKRLRRATSAQALGSNKAACPECFLCGDCIAGNRSRTWCGKKFHVACCEGVQSYMQQPENKTADAKARLAKMLMEDPDAWRQRITDSMDPTAFQDAAAQSSPAAVLRDVPVLPDLIGLTEVRYTAFHMFWDRWSEGECPMSFHLKHLEQGKPLDRAQAPIVWEEDIPRKSQASSDTGAIGSASAPLTAASRGGRSRQAPSQKQVSPTKSFSSGGSEVFPEDSASQVGQRPASHASHVARVRQKQTEKAESALGQGECDHVDFLKEREEFKDLLQAMKKDSGLPSTPGAKLEAALKTLAEDLRKDLDADPAALVTTWKACVAKIDPLLQQAARVRKGNLEPLKMQAEVIETELKHHDKAAADSLAAISFLVATEKQKKRATQMHQRYEKTKVATKLSGNGWGKEAAAKVGQLLAAGQQSDAIVIDPQVFDHKLVQIFTAATSEQPFMKTLVGFFEATCTEAKIAELEKSMTHNSQWRGAMAKLEAISLGTAEWKLQDAKPLEPEAQGSSPWLAAVRQFTYRHGPGAVPLCGAGSFLRSAGEDQDLHVCLFPVQGLVEKGIAVDDLAKFLETKQGQEYQKMEMCMARVPHGSFLWIPYGLVAVPVVMEKPVAFLWLLPFLFKDWLLELPESARRSVITFNNAYMEKKKQAKIWMDRIRVWELLTAG
eukprot:gnl/TRDRNA2_/TRDRNA2_178552_c0_seq1.p1 gnl/TRDRNA2_/TRDRNA2_178552_c0~~gnl/TRDRNA2_/TRDRNA2_178552_c0_seq1.p1  ORF type:complete len:706 (+),score=169.73 gnl/TRDRNA2_/TRDRNA2_178552_c0_seq1:48-2120(+)